VLNVEGNKRPETGKRNGRVEIPFYLMLDLVLDILRTFGNLDRIILDPERTNVAEPEHSLAEEKFSVAIILIDCHFYHCEFLSLALI